MKVEDNAYKVLADKLRTIRESLPPLPGKKNMNQEDFYNKYLAGIPTHDGNKEKANSTAQGIMSRIENGTAEVPALWLPVYADLAGCTVSELLSNTSDVHTPKGHDNKQICSFLVDLIETHNVALSTIEVDEVVFEGRAISSNPEEGTRHISYPCLYFSEFEQPEKQWDRMEYEGWYGEVVDVSNNIIWNVFINDFLKKIAFYKSGVSEGHITKDDYLKWIENDLRNLTS